MSRRRTWNAVLLLLACLATGHAGSFGATAGAVPRQSEDEDRLSPYLAHVLRFRASAPPVVADDFLRVPDDRLDREVAAFVGAARRRDPRARVEVVEAAVLIHLAAASEPGTTRESRDHHVSRAQSILDATRGTLPDSFERQAALLSIWLCQGHGEIERAIRLLDAALTRFRPDAELLLAQGTLWETIAGLRDDERPKPSRLEAIGPVVVSELPALELRIAPVWEQPLRIYERCGLVFDRAIELAPGLDEARVRSASVKLAQGLNAHAARVLTPLVTGSNPPHSDPIAYYAALLHGRALAAMGDYPGAITSSRRALSICGACQSARMAMSQVLRDSGDLPSSRVFLLNLLETESAPDPWWDYPLGQIRNVPETIRRLLAGTRR